MVEEKAFDVFKSWVEELLNDLGGASNESMTREIMEKCGTRCVIAHNDLSKIKAVKRKEKNFYELLSLINKYLEWCGEWKLKGNIIYAIGKECGCPLVRHRLVKLSPVLCFCSRGWIKTIFEEALDKEVEVHLVRSIGRGDDCCEFRVIPFVNKQ